MSRRGPLHPLVPNEIVVVTEVCGAMIDDRVRVRLSELSSRLGDADWLDAEFSAGDVMMVGLLRRLGSSSILEKYPNLAAYVARGEARPAFKRAFDAQLAVFLAGSNG